MRRVDGSGVKKLEIERRRLDFARRRYKGHPESIIGGGGALWTRRMSAGGVHSDAERELGLLVLT